MQLIRYLSFDATRRSTHILIDGIAKDAAIFARKCGGGPVSILLRTYDDGFDTIRQYDVEINRKWREGSEEEDTRFPYVLPTQPTRAIGVAPSSCDLLVGPNGIGFWVQTKNVTAKRSIFPARCLVGFDFTHSHSAEGGEGQGGGENHERENEGEAPKTVDGANDMYLCQREVYARRCDMSEIICRRYALMSADIEDAVGRIVIGYRHGWVEVLDYV